MSQSIPLVPTTESDLVDIVSSAVASKTPLAPVGLGTKSGVGRPVNHVPLHMSGMSGIVDYEPKELVLTVKAGTPVDEVVNMLAEFGQELPFEPVGGIDASGRWACGTIGGMMMTNFSGPRRLKVGAVRDHVLGLRAVSGRAEAFKAGGKVVKNVTGYDLARGLCGSWGTLAVASEVTFKVLPKAEHEATVVVPDLGDAEAVDLMCRAMQQSFDISGAAHLTTALASLPIELPGLARTALRLEGFEASVVARVEHLMQFLSGLKGVEIVSGNNSRRLWEWIARIQCHGHRGSILWRISVPPAQGAAVAAEIEQAFGYDPECAFAYDWSGGLIWVWIDVYSKQGNPPDLGASIIRSAIAANGGGHATLMHGPIQARGTIDVFQPQAPALAALTKRLKHQFDPEGILNPGRMSADA